MGGGEHIAPRQQLAQPLEAVEMVLDHLLEQAGGEPESGDLGALQELPQLHQGGRVGREDDQAGAVQQRRPELKGRGIEREGRKQEKRLRRRQARIVGLLDEADDALVRDASPFGPAGRAGRIDDIGQVQGGGVATRVLSASGSDLLPVGVQTEHLGLVLGEAREEVLLGEQHRHLAVGEHEGKPLGRIGGLERDVGAAGLQDPEQGLDHGRGAIHAEPD